MHFRFILSITFSCLLSWSNTTVYGQKISVSFPQSLKDTTYDGRLLLMLSSNSDREPRFQINDGPSSQLIFGVNVEAWSPGQSITFDASVFGYPYPSLTDVPDGEYTIRALLHAYETFHLSTGPVSYTHLTLPTKA